MILSALHEDTLFPAIMFSFVGSLSCFIFGPYVGSWVDRTERKKCLQISLYIFHGATAVNGFVMGILVHLVSIGKVDTLLEWHFFVPFSVACLVSAVAELANMASGVSLEKDWAIVVAQHDERPLLEVNAMLKRIDLFSNVLAPLFFGLILAFTNSVVGLIFVSIWNLVSMVPEVILVHLIFQSVPALAQKPEQSRDESPKHPLKALLSGWSIYLTHKVSLTSLAYVLLYITVLSGGVSIISYLNSLGVSPIWIAVFSGVASVMGILSTLVVVPLVSYFGNVLAGQIFLALQLSFLVLSVFSFFFFSEESSPIRIFFFLAGIVLSRCGLWLFDMVEVQQIQILVEPEHRGIFNATESALTNLASLVILGLGLIFNHPSQFKWLVIISFSCVTLANVLYFLWWQLFLKGVKQIVERTTDPTFDDQPQPLLSEEADFV